MKLRSSSLRGISNAQPACSAAVDFLRSDGKLSTVLPMAARLVELQRECSQALPQLFESCAVMKLEEGTLVLSAPNAAAAARIKQKLPGLQDKLVQTGWRIEGIRVKVQVKTQPAAAYIPAKKPLPQQALSSIAELRENIAQSRNQALTDALDVMLKRHGIKK